MSKVFVIDTDKRPLDRVHPAQARQLLRNKKAAVYKRFPFTIILKESRPSSSVSPLRLKIDPGAKHTGIALVNDATGEVVFAAHLKHRGFAIREALTSRRQLRRGRRSRKTRYRQPRFLKRTRPQSWLASSLQSRVENIRTWVERLRRVAPITAISQELVRFDMQLMRNPDIQGKEYQQGTLFGCETREFLLEKSIAANGHGTRQLCRTDKFDFPSRHCSRTKFHFGFQITAKGHTVMAGVSRRKDR